MLSADGCVEVLNPADSGCCPPPLCGNDLCCTFVAFFQLLPSGPMWDYWKAQAIGYFQSNEDPAQCPLVTDPRCPSLILHAIYTVLKLRAMVHGPLWTSYRESNPYTMVTTVDAYLERLQWEDCYNQHCRSVLLGEITPLEIWTECGPLFCEPNFPPELTAALKRGVAIALTRAQMGVIKNLCGINWVIDPLGAVLTPDIPEVPAPPITEPCDPALCSDAKFILCNSRDWLEGPGTGDVCATLTPLPQVPAFWDLGCDRPAGLPQVVWPGVLAAECIVRSMMPPACPSNITRCC